jgi:two-component system chemotaxis response regulator CheB
MSTDLLRASVEAVVIGGSEGSLQALYKLLPLLPSNYPPAVVVVLHQFRHGGRLPQVLAPYSRLPVHPIEDKDRLIAGTVHICPANYHTLIEPDRSAALSTDAPVRFARPSIDLLFETAARVYGKHLWGVLLSGASSDGAAGLSEISQAGGITWVQDPSTATSPIMPRAGQKATPKAWMASPEVLGQRLAALQPP